MKDEETPEVLKTERGINSKIKALIVRAVVLGYQTPCAGGEGQGSE